MSIHRYDLRTGREHNVLMSDGTEIYRLMGLLPGKALIVLNESGLAGRPRYILESRRLDGTRPARLYEGYARPFFIGWVRQVS
jgi:hypothetical protein